MTGSVPRILLADLKNAEVSAWIPHLFKQAGCKVEVFCGPDSWLLKNKDYDIWHQANNRDFSIYAESLKQLVQTECFDWIVLTDDYVIRVMNKSVTEPDVFEKIFSTVPWENRVLLGTKAGLSELCATYTIQTPGFAIYDPDSDLVSLTAQLNFPILLKVNESGGGKGIALVNSPEELLKNFNTVPADQRKDLVFQEYIKGDNVSVEALFKNGRLLGFSSAKVILNTAGEYSISRVREYKNFPGLESELIKIGSSFCLNGFCSMTIMRSEISGQFYLVETDLRPHGWFYLAKFAGLDFSQLIKMYLSDEKNEPIKTNTQVQTIRYFSRDIKWAIQTKNFRVIKDWCVNKNDCWRFTPWSDQKLFWATIGGIIKFAIYLIKPLQPVTRSLKRWYRRVKGFLLE